MNKSRSLRSLSVLSILGASFAVAACSSDDERANEAFATVHVNSALSLTVDSIDGAYGTGCTGHSENETWSAAAESNASLTHAPLRVRRGDTSCVLKLTHMHAASQTFEASPALTLGATYGAASAFNDDAISPVDFYGVAKLGDASFQNDFSIDILLNAPTNEGSTETKYPDGFEETFSVSVGNVPAPSYNVSTSAHTLLTDPSNIVTTSIGYIELTPSGTSAQTYAVVNELIPPGRSPAALADDMANAAHSGSVASPYRIPASELELIGEDITNGVGRSIILRNTDQGVSSYQVLRFYFAPRPVPACDVTCASGDRVACGAALNQALGAGGTIRVCPGEYEGPFPLTANVQIIGSGSGNNPAVDTILVGKSGLGSVVPVTSAITAVLGSVRITGGNGAGSNSGGVYVNNASADVTINGSALVGNSGNYGGGASVYSGKLTITDSEISNNTAAGSGGGVATATQVTITSTRITGNTASNSGGGVFVNSGTANLGADVTIAGNTSNGGAGTGGGIYKFTAGSTINNSASVANNAPENCAGNGFTCP